MQILKWKTKKTLSQKKLNNKLETKDTILSHYLMFTDYPIIIQLQSTCKSTSSRFIQTQTNTRIITSTRSFNMSVRRPKMNSVATVTKTFPRRSKTSSRCHRGNRATVKRRRGIRWRRVSVSFFPARCMYRVAINNRTACREPTIIRDPLALNT